MSDLCLTTKKPNRVEDSTSKLLVKSALGFTNGQTIIIGESNHQESATSASIAARQRFEPPTAGQSDTLVLFSPIKLAHSENSPIAGSGITLTSSTINFTNWECHSPIIFQLWERQINTKKARLNKIG